MKIPMQLIKDELETYTSFIFLLNKHENRGGYHIIPFTPDTVDDKCNDENIDFLYYGMAQDFSDDLKNYGLICIGKPSEKLLKQNDILYFTGKIDFMKLYINIQNVFLKFNRWDDTLHQALKDNQPFDTLFRIAANIFENSMFMHDVNFFQLACVDRRPEEAAWIYDDKRDKYYLPVDILNDFKVNTDYLKTMSTKGPSLFPATTFGYNILYQNLWYNDQYRGRICVNELCRKLRKSDAYLLNYFSDIVMEAFKLVEVSTLKPSVSLSRFLIRLIEEKTVDKMTMDTILMQHGWSFKDDYFCVCLFPEERDTHTNSIQYQCNRLADTFSQSCVFYYDKCIVMLINSTLTDTTIPMFQNHIALILRESLMKAGISSICSDLNQFRYYYWQAISAFETGKSKQETFWCYCFDDYKTSFTIHSALRQFPAEMLCEKKIFLLEEYDKTHTSNLCITLQIYIENERNIARTAEILDIHRSTLLYRIERIEKITELELDNSEVRFSLLLSYHLLEESRGHILFDRKVYPFNT